MMLREHFYAVDRDEMLAWRRGSDIGLARLIQSVRQNPHEDATAEAARTPYPIHVTGEQFIELRDQLFSQGLNTQSALLDLIPADKRKLVLVTGLVNEMLTVGDPPYMPMVDVDVWDQFAGRAARGMAGPERAAFQKRMQTYYLYDPELKGGASILGSGNPLAPGP